MDSQKSFFYFFSSNVLFFSFSLWRELCHMLLMCVWQLNLISRLLVKKALDCSHRKNTLFFFFFFYLPCSSKCCRAVCRWPSSERWSKTRKSRAKSTGRRKERRQEGSGRRKEKYIVRRDTISKKSSCGKLTQMLLFFLSPSRLLTLPPPALSSLPSWAPLPCSLIGRETLGTISGISFHCSPAPLG